MEIVVKGLPSGYEVENLARVFYPQTLPRGTASTRGEVIYARVNARRIAVALRTEGRCMVRCAAAPPSGQAKLALCRLLYELLHVATGLRPPWGMLTGVRPVRLLRRALATGGEEAARQKLLGEYDASQEKYDLARGIVQVQQPFIDAVGADNCCSVYVSIPFCPTRCAYCSFVSRTIEREGALIPAYLDKLGQELAVTAQLVQQHGLAVRSVYIGGGTPTALSAQQLQQLLALVQQYFDAASLMEYTVEAGRPDCTDFEKLLLLKQYGVSRISINPQTMVDSVLQEIGRRHTAAEVVRCFEDARRAGHTNINMDTIAGLPGDSPAGFAYTLDTLLALAPENITVHTLTLKRASDIVIDKRAGISPPAQMLQEAYPRLAAAGYRPYYLYRQKSTVENLENTGWARPGTEGLYNIAIMEEIHSILAVGAGASTKMVAGQGAEIRRLYNHKFPADYVREFDTVLQRKREVGEFYASHLDTKTPR